ncbi:hypothetical protein Tco_0884177, partial [Tanacetum coccineum]
HKARQQDKVYDEREESCWILHLCTSIFYLKGHEGVMNEVPDGAAIFASNVLRWTCGKTMLDMIPNGVYRAELEVETIINKMREGRLRWFGHVRRRPQSTPVRRVEALAVDGMRRRGRPKLRWEDRVKFDMKELLLSEDMTSDRNELRARIILGG